MYNKILPYLSILLISFFSVSCGGWNKENKQDVKDKCQAKKYDCDCYLKVTTDMFLTPEDYNNAGDKKLSSYQKRLKKDCLNKEEKNNKKQQWEDEDIGVILKKCPEGYDKDCYMSQAMSFFDNKKEFLNTLENSNKEKMSTFNSKIKGCKLKN